MFSQQNKTKIIVITIVCFIVMLLCLFFTTTPAFADDGGYMTDINFRSFVESPNDTGQSKLLTGGTNILQALVTYILLPIAIVFVVWKIVVVGICTIIGVDYSKFIELDIHPDSDSTPSAQKRARKKWGYNTSSSSGDDLKYKSPKDSSTAIKDLAKDTIKGLIIVFCVWGIIELIMAGVYIFIEMGKNFGG